jgi:hypothetical protein
MRGEQLPSSRRIHKRVTGTVVTTVRRFTDPTTGLVKNFVDKPPSLHPREIDNRLRRTGVIALSAQAGQQTRDFPRTPAEEMVAGVFDRLYHEEQDPKRPVKRAGIVVGAVVDRPQDRRNARALEREIAGAINEVSDRANIPVEAEVLGEPVVDHGDTLGTLGKVTSELRDKDPLGNTNVVVLVTPDNVAKRSLGVDLRESAVAERVDTHYLLSQIGGLSTGPMRPIGN